MRRLLNLNPNSGSQGYDRPNLDWQCGNEDQGCPCSVGPSAGGECPKLAECAPTKEGDRWICGRSVLRGGPCDDQTPGGGPTPEGACCLLYRCKPKRTLRVLRGRWAGGVAIFVLGAILMVLGFSGRNALIAPGPLSSHHAQVIHRDLGEQRCATCHPAANESSFAWLSRATGFGKAGEEEISQSQLCLNCHQSLLAAGGAPLLPHGLPEGQLLSSTAFEENGQHAGDLACAACHQEHHGKEHNLSALSDARCQACHQERYQSFASDHPEFGLWPVHRRTRIAFNHASHQLTHHTKANRPFDCRACHTTDAAGDLTARPTYAQACASCHDAAFQESFSKGVALVALPSVDDAVLEAAKLPLLDWPDNARGDFDGDLPALMKLLLAADPAAAEAMRSLDEDFSFFDLDPDSADEVAQAAKLMQTIRTLLDELQEEGHDAIAYRLRQLGKHEKLPHQLGDYVGRLPVELIDHLQVAWFGPSDSPLTEPFDEVQERRTGGGWRFDPVRLALRYQPSDHDDPMLRAWIDLIVALPEEHAALRDATLVEFSRPGAIGACLTCHSIDQTDAGSRIVHWSGRDRLAEPKRFTHFSHRPHLTQPELADCSHCHQINAAAEVTAYTSLNPEQFRSEFVTLRKQACIQCHQPHAAGDNCTQCHNYHVSSQEGSGEGAKLPVGVPPSPSPSP